MGVTDGAVTTAAGKEVLVPMTTSLYVPGTMADTETVIVDVGTGYFVEKVRHTLPRVSHLQFSLSLEK